MSSALTIPCPLCQNPQTEFLMEGYLHCPVCDLRFLEPSRRMNPEAERARYALHNNTFEDPRYRQFLLPLAERLRQHLPPPATGLDFGAGKAAVLADILAQMGYITSVYDPFFANQPELLTLTYDFVCASEVVEHFYNPGAEFLRLHGLLRPGGFLAVMTALYNETQDFRSWYYRKDPTHVAFYSSTTFVWIAKRFGFRAPHFHGDRIVVLRDRRE